uniref:Uncharacterized protein n=1 Tax=Arundo donax TaxID=35708 RepID=A0A0A9FT95_ARUDO
MATLRIPSRGRSRAIITRHSTLLIPIERYKPQ